MPCETEPVSTDATTEELSTESTTDFRFRTSSEREGEQPVINFRSINQNQAPSYAIQPESSSFEVTTEDVVEIVDEMVRNPEYRDF